MRVLHFILAAIACVPVGLAAQNTISFKGQVFNAAHQVMPRLRLQINNRLLSTNDSGFFQVTLPKTNTHLKLSIPLSDYFIIYPSGGHIAIPRELKDVPEVIVGKANDIVSFRQYLSRYVQKDSFTTNEKSELDSLKHALLAIGVTATQLTNAELAASEKQEYVVSLTSDVLQFRNAVYKLNVDFTSLAAKALEDGAALDKLLKSVVAYDSCYMKFDPQHAVYENWRFSNRENDQLPTAVKPYSDYIVQKVHAEGVYPIQELILQVKQYFSVKKKNKDLRKSIEGRINKLSAQVDRLFPELDKKTAQLLISITAP